MTGTTAVTGTTLLIHSKLVGSGIYNSAIISQTGSKRFKTVQTASSTTGVAYLVPTDALEAGQAYMHATDSTGATYFVSKITDRLVTVVRHSGAENSGGPVTSPPTTGWLFLTNTQVPWTTDSVVPAGYVKLEVY